MQIGDVVSDDLVQFVTLVLSVIGALLWLRWGLRANRVGYAIAPITFLIHRALFYVVITFWRIPNADVVMWSSAISLHSVLTLIMATIVMIVFARQRRLRV